LSSFLDRVAHTNTEFGTSATSETGWLGGVALRLHATRPGTGAPRFLSIDPRRGIGETPSDGLPRVAAGKQDWSDEFRAKDDVTAGRPGRRRASAA
jgi:hypothetical protein